MRAKMSRAVWLSFSLAVLSAGAAHAAGGQPVSLQIGDLRVQKTMLPWGKTARALLPSLGNAMNVSHVSRLLGIAKTVTVVDGLGVEHRLEYRSPVGIPMKGDPARFAFTTVSTTQDGVQETRSVIGQLGSRGGGSIETVPLVRSADIGNEPPREVSIRAGSTLFAREVYFWLNHFAANPDQRALAAP